ncbi:MAG: glycosyltransferase family 2 protein [Bacteriovoracia bacterium]
MKPELSLFLPSKGETRELWQTIRRLHDLLGQEKITHEFVVVNDVKVPDEGGTASMLRQFAGEGMQIQYIERLPPEGGFGSAVKLGLEKFSAPAVMILMSDGSEDPQDVVRFFRKFQEGYDCVFGNRFTAGGKIEGYSGTKLIWNRLANYFLSLVFFLPYRDFTNASKLYSRRAIDGFGPIFSEHFNITIELPLKAFLRGYKVAVLPNTWRADAPRESNLRLSAMGRRYLHTALLLLRERWLP